MLFRSPDQKGNRERQLESDLGVCVRSVRDYLRDVSKADKCPRLPSTKLVRSIQDLTGVRSEYILRGELPKLATEVASGDWSADLCAWLRAELGEIDPTRNLTRRKALILDPAQLKAFIVAAVRASEDADDRIISSQVELVRSAALHIENADLLIEAGYTARAKLTTDTAAENIVVATNHMKGRMFQLFSHTPEHSSPLPRFRIEIAE